MEIRQYFMLVLELKAKLSCTELKVRLAFLSFSTYVSQCTVTIIIMGVKKQGFAARFLSHPVFDRNKIRNKTWDITLDDCIISIDDILSGYIGFI